MEIKVLVSNFSRDMIREGQGITIKEEANKELQEIKVDERLMSNHRDNIDYIVLDKVGCRRVGINLNENDIIDVDINSR